MESQTHEFLATLPPNVLVEVRCCCNPERLVGFLPFSVGQHHGLTLRELDDNAGYAFDIETIAGSFASNEERTAFVMNLPTFVAAPETFNRGTKTWKKATDDGMGEVLPPTEQSYS